MWFNLQDQLPPQGVQVNVSLNGTFYVGVLGTNNVLQLTGYMPVGITTNPVYWALIPPVK